MTVEREPDFIPVLELSRRTGFSVGGLRNQLYSGKGPLAPILCRLGGRVGCWTADYKQWTDSQRKFVDTRPHGCPTCPNDSQ